MRYVNPCRSCFLSQFCPTLNFKYIPSSPGLPVLSPQPLLPFEAMRRNLTPRSMIPAQGVLPSFEVAPPILVPQQLTLNMGYKQEQDSSTESH
ncbi:hypothetical protein FA13DRAFT_1035553 [Coprinellus micaceus]|uniref:Uncharacterized protein n=1 Tax=Coprinellus micaceus TaxID=71717 RepID=A0A4Y7RMV7_COPMI|nr:hypothetical protein FA13DRAFT_1035553 [Coprinellus micaceus]